MYTVDQLRSDIAALAIPTHELASRSGVSARTIQRALYAKSQPTPANLASLRRAIHDALLDREERHDQVYAYPDGSDVRQR